MRKLIVILILTIFNPERKAILETNILDYTIGAYLAQKRNDDKMRTVIYYFRKITRLELNYDIYDKELLVVVEALRE